MGIEAHTPTGILTPAGLGTVFRLERYAPSEDLSGLVLRYWTVEWDLPRQAAYAQETLPYPCVNLVVEPERSSVVGVNTRRFHVQLAGRGRVFGVKFRPGAFFPLYGTPVVGLTDRSVALAEIFGAAGEALERRVLACDDVGAMLAHAERFLRERLPPADPNVALIGDVVELIAGDRAITRVAQVTERIGVSQRTLQRLFDRYVGVGPKWVIQRYRLLEATEQLARGAELDLGALALDLGYYDQAHFTTDFRAAVGSTPAEYLRGVAREGSAAG